MNRNSLISSLRFAAVMLLLTLGRGAWAADDVVVRLEANPESPWVGQKVVLQLDVLGKDSWAQLKNVQEYELQGGYLKRFETQGTRLQETIEGASYTGQRYEFLFFPQRSGTIPIDSMAIDVEIKRWGSNAGSDVAELSTPDLLLDVRTPDGVPSMRGIASTPAFTATQTWDPDQTDLQAGDAVKRSIVFKAEDVSGMVLPAVEPAHVEGIGVYPSSPRVDDTYVRGDLTGIREETITYVMEQPGTHQLPELSFSWWNIKTEKLATVTLDGRSLTVAALPGSDGNSGADSGLTAGAERESRRQGAAQLILVLAVGCVLVCVFLWRRSLRQRYQVWREKREHAEKSYFLRVTHASRSEDTHGLMIAAMQWLDRISDDAGPPRLDRFAEKYGTADDLETIYEFSSLDSSGGNSRRMHHFYETLTTLRKNWLNAQKEQLKQRKAEQILPPIDLI